jgi:endonuclease-3
MPATATSRPTSPAKFKEKPEARKARAAEIVRRLHKLYPDATCALKHESPLHLLVATILSAQCTDERVNLTTPALFKRFRTAKDFATADPAQLETMIRSTGFFRNKTKSIIGAGRTMVEKFKGAVPDTMEALLELPGVARKTANVILGTWFQKNEGVVVDTHIGRLAHRLKLSWTSKGDKDAVRIEQDLMQILPQKEWTFTGHALIWHGRKVCTARKPACAECKLNDICPSAFSFGIAPTPPGAKTRKSKP